LKVTSNRKLNSFAIKLILMLAIFTCGAGYCSGQEVTESFRIEREDGLQEHNIAHFERDANGYFYLFGLDQIYRFDGSALDLVNVEVLRKDGFGVRDIILVQHASDGSLLISMVDSDFNYIIRSSSLKLSKYSKPISQKSFSRRYN